ncbi:MAG: FtsX-like permease family protein [Promethearchaeota archaeon]
MSLRLVNKAFILAKRSKKRFIAFLSVYVVLIIWTSFAMHQWYKDFVSDGFSFNATFFFMVVSVCANAVMSMVYANIIVSNRKMEIATFKCIGWNNNHVRALIIGEIFSVTLIAFIVVIEIVFHFIAIGIYILSINDDSMFPTAIIPIGLFPMILTFGIMLLVQVVGILFANGKILRVRPIQALQMKV